MDKQQHYRHIVLHVVNQNQNSSKRQNLLRNKILICQAANQSSLYSERFQKDKNYIMRQNFLIVPKFLQTYAEITTRLYL
jgi:hypothetical protein